MFCGDRKMATESQMHDDATTVAATSIATTSRANAPQHMAPAERLGKFAGIDFKRWKQKMFFYLTTLYLQRFTSEELLRCPREPRTKSVS